MAGVECRWTEVLCRQARYDKNKSRERLPKLRLKKRKNRERSHLEVRYLLKGKRNKWTAPVDPFGQVLSHVVPHKGRQTDLLGFQRQILAVFGLEGREKRSVQPVQAAL